METVQRETQEEGNKKQQQQQKRKTCDVGGMMVVSDAIGETGITGIMGEEGGLVSAC